MKTTLDKLSPGSIFYHGWDRHLDTIHMESLSVLSTSGLYSLPLSKMPETREMLCGKDVGWFVATHIDSLLTRRMEDNPTNIKVTYVGRFEILG